MNHEKFQAESARQPPPGDVTQLLNAINQGDPSAMGRLLPIVYRELRSMAKDLLRRERVAHTLQPTALVHEAYLKLVRQDRAQFESRNHFLAIAATAMRRILVNHARRRNRIRHGGRLQHEPLSESLVIGTEPGVDLIALDEAIQRLGAIDPRKVRVVELRYFAGMSVDQTADVLSVSPATIKRDWEFARTWLLRELARND